MDLFWFSKLQDFFYTGLNKLLLFMFLVYRKPSARILPKERNGIFILCLWVAIILAPCSVECSSLRGFQEVSKIKNSSPMLRKCILQKSCEVDFHGILGGVKCQEFVFEGFPKFHGSPASLSNIGQREGKPVSEPCAKESTDNGKTSSDKCYFVGTKVQFWVALLSGHLIGLAISIAII